MQQTLTTLIKGEIIIKGQFMWGSNYTFLVEVKFNASTLPAVYKPSEGERLLWDFPAATLAHREVAAYLVSEAIGWELVPPTVYRYQGPAGPGSLQLFVEHNPDIHFFTFPTEKRQNLRVVALFDLLINNADRKGGHLLVGEDGHLWLIDHGVCFHVEDKLRTVIWNFAGETIPNELLVDIKSFHDRLTSEKEFRTKLEEHLSHQEVIALIKRAKHLLEKNFFPQPPDGRRSYPWPPV